MLDALAVTLRNQVGPEVANPFAKTQAFMAAVILEKLAGQLRAVDHAGELEGDERHALLVDIEAICADPPPALDRAVHALASDGSDAAWCGLVTAIYADREALGPAFDRLLARLRITLRARLDRTLVYAS